jgi:pyruvate formate lyase activating enzyme
MDKLGIASEEVDIKSGGMDTFRKFYAANRGVIFRGEEGIEFPIYTDGTVVRQGVGVVIAYLVAGAKLDGFIGRSQLFKGWIDGLHVSGGDPSLAEELVTLLSFLKKNGLQLHLDTNGENASVLQRLLDEGLGDRVIMEVKGPLALYGKMLGKEIAPGEIEKTIALLPKFPEYEFRTTVAPVIRQEGKKPEISYLTPEEIGETAKLIEETTGSHQQPYLLRLFEPGAGSDEQMKAVEKLPYNAMFKYRTAARKHLKRTEIEKS